MPRRGTCSSLLRMGVWDRERTCCGLGEKGTASPIEGPGMCLVAGLSGAEGSGSLPWTSRVPLPLSFLPPAPWTI